jgi:hypothetical protein
VVETAVGGIEDCASFFADLLTELELDRAIVEVFQEGDFVQHVSRNV